jgi:hypothetical protein
MASKLTPILEIAREILKTAGLKGLHVDQIAVEAAKQNKNLSLPQEDFSKKLQAALAANLNLKTQKPSFARVEGKKKGSFKRGWYRVKLERTQPVVALIVAPETEKAFTGKAGEFAVMSELLFWGYNASVMTVDNGIDVIASKGGKYFHIQVKTAAEQEGGRFTFTIKNSSFLQHHSSSMFYVFVLRRKLSNEYIIIPSSYLHALVTGGKVSGGPTLSVTIAVDANGRKYMLNGNTNIDVYVGNFGGLIV